MSQDKVSPLCPERFSGKELGLVVGIDVGTTFSGVSYAILRPDEVPEILPVTRFSGLTGSCKIPSVIYYNESLEIKAIGAATTLDTMENEAESNDWFKCKHFKLHLRPGNINLETNGFELGALPLGKSAEDVMADFLKYLIEATAVYIQTSHTDGSQIWENVKDKIEFVIGHPNNWAGKPQERYRQAAISAGLIPDTLEGRKRLHFITEGEASALACLAGGLSPSPLTTGFRFIVVDAGGGTIDVSSYRVRKASPIELEECAPSDCMFAGSEFVNGYGHQLLQRTLKGSEFDDEETLRDMVKTYFEGTKRCFTGDGFHVRVRVGNSRLHDKKLGIRGGFLQLKSQDIAGCFNLSIRETSASIRRQSGAMKCEPRKLPVWIVGGFGGSPYLTKKLSESFTVESLASRKSPVMAMKAVAVGAVLYCLDKAVKARCAKNSYGVPCLVPFSALEMAHVERMHMLSRDHRGILLIGPVFSCILEKGTILEATKSFRETYEKIFSSKEEAKEFEKDILVYDGKLPCPIWYRENEHKFRKLCTLRADLSEMYPKSMEDPNPNASMIERLRTRWTARFDIEIKLGTTELEAAFIYDVDGETKRGSVSILYD